MFNKFSVARTALASAVLMSFSTEVLAQALAIEEVTVTTRRRAESIQDVPLSITAFTDIQIERNGIRNIQDVARLVPGLTYDLGFSPQDTRPAIRGIPATRGRPPVGILIDGIDVSSEAIQTGGGGSLMNLRLVDVERIEVVKGPQSALFGRVAFAGAINYITKQPTDELNSNIFVDLGDHEQVEVRAGVSGPLFDSSKLGFRLNAAYASHDGFHENAVSGETIGGFESVGLSGVLSAELSETAQATLRVSYSEDEGEARPQIYSGGVNFFAAPTNPLGLTGALAPAFGRLSIADGDVTRLSLDPFTGEDYAGTTLDAFVGSLKVEWDLTDTITLTSLTGYNEADASESLDSDKFGVAYTDVALPLPGGVNEPLSSLSANQFMTNTRQISQEIRLSDLNSDGFRWAIGGLYWDESVDQRDRSYFVVDFLGTGSAGLSAALIGPGGLNEGRSQRDLEHWSAYAHVEFDITERLTLVAEARYADDSYVYDVDGSVNLALGFANPDPIPFPPAPSIPVARSSDDYFTPSLTLDYQATEDVLLFATVAKGAKPGGFSTLSIGNTLDNARFEPETLWSYQLGAKTRFADDRVQLNGTLFYMDYSDKQLDTQDASGGQGLALRSIVLNAAKAEIRGLEADVQLAVTDQVTLTGAYTYMDTEYTDFVFATLSGSDITRGGNCTPDVIAGNTVCQVSLTGNQLERQPKHAFTVGASGSFPVSDDLSLIADISAQYQGSRFLAQWNRWTLPSYINVDARLGVEADQWSIIAYADNLFDSDRVRSAQENFDLFTFGTSINLFEPDSRQVGVRLSYRM